MSTHSYEINEAQPDQTAERPYLDPGQLSDPEENDDLLFDVQAAAVRGFYTPYHLL